MIKENKIYNIVIYGNGLSAKTAVASFSHQGFKPIWVNSIKKEKYEDDRTTMLSPKSVEFYRKLNLDKLSKDIFPTNKILIKTKNQKVYTTFEDNQLQKPLCYLVENKILHKDLDALIATQKKEKIVLEFNDEIDKLQNNQNYNEIFLKSGVTLRSSLVVGLDGANSLIRELSGIKSKNYGIKKYGLVGLIEHEMRHPFTSWQVFSKNGILALLAKENKSKNRSVSSMIWSLDKEQMNYLLNLETKDFEKQIENEIGSDLGKLNLVSKLSQWPINRMDVSDPTDLRTVVLGDASHSIYPLAGQGFNLGVGDIIQLLETLDWARSHGMDFGTSIVLNKYKDKRKFWVNSVTRLTDGLDWFFSNTTTQTQDKFGISLEILGKLKPLKQKLVILMRNN